MTYTDALLIGVIIGIVELLKILGVPKKILPIASLILGVISGMVYLFPEDPQAGILMGIIMGLSASGLYSGSKNILEKDNKDNKDTDQLNE